MGKICILDENTANKIAAGEVIERPASVVKELVENSIDAGADNVSIEIKNGGITYIKISDNGSGIREDDAEIAFERHATSKIRSADDLEHVLTMGFRGEALASIAAVSDIQLTTRVQDSEYGTFVEIRGGRTIDVKKSGCPVGTTFVIRDLFYNTPARFKFLKKDSTEAGYISEAVTRIALGNPGVSFRLSAGGQQILYTPGNKDQLSAIFSIYGRETAKNVCEIHYSDEKIKISGYAGMPEIARSNRSHQYVYINKRYIKSKIIMSAVDEAYNTFLMKNKFPFILLNVEINPMMVDVNVHPTKMEVKFSGEQDIFKAVYHAVNNALLQNSEIRQAVVNEKPSVNPFKMGRTGEDKEFEQQKIQFKTVSDYQGKSEIIVSGSKIDNRDGFVYEKVTGSYSTEAGTGAGFGVQEGLKSSGSKPPVNVAATAQAVDKQSEEYAPDKLKMPLYVNNTAAADITVKKLEPEATCGLEHEMKQMQEEISVAEQQIDKQIEQPVKLQLKQQTEQQAEQGVVYETEVVAETEAVPESVKEPRYNHIFEGAKIIGQVFNTYIILEKDEQMILIDQHAAHERIMYEELKTRFDSLRNVSQLLLDSVVIELTHQEYKLLEEEKELFERLGFDYDAFGSNSVILRAVPFSSLEQNAREAFTEVLDRMLGKAKNERVAEVNNTIYTVACKAAVKANKRLDEAEIGSLLEQLSRLENPYTCPHGRPSAVKITKYEMEKMFKRIV